MITKKIALASAITALMASGTAFAGNSDSDGDGLFETKGAAHGSTINLDGSDGLFGTGSDYWSWTTNGAGPMSNTRQVLLGNLAGSDQVEFTWTTGGGPDVLGMYADGAAGWEAPTALDPLIAQPFVPDAIGASVVINGVNVAEGSIFTLSAADLAAAGNVLTITTSWDNTVTPEANAMIHGIIGADITAVPVPAAAWLFGSSLLGLAGIGRKRKMG